VREYRKAVEQWKHPGIVLGLAQAELRVGNVETASELMRSVQASSMAYDLRYAIEDLQMELKRTDLVARRSNPAR
jgi:hypothetical protein